MPWLATLCLTLLLTATGASAQTITLSLQLGRLQYSVLDANYSGNTYYTVNVLLSSDIPPVTYDEVDSPGNQYGGTEGGYGDAYFGDVASAVASATNGVWTLIVNKGDVSEQQYTFTVSANALNESSLPAVTISTPADGATGVATNTTFNWSGPATWSSLDLLDNIPDYSFYYPAYPAPTTTTWAISGLPSGTNIFTATYATNAAQWITISTPVDNLANPFTNWVSGSQLFVSGQSDFIAGTPATGPYYGGHTLMAHYTFDDDTIYTADLSGNGNDITQSSSIGSGSTVYITNDAEAGPYAANFISPQDSASATWLIPPTNLLSTLAGSFTASLWLKTTNFGYGLEGAGILTANYTSFFTNVYGVALAYELPGNVIPMSLTGQKLSFLTTGHTGDDTLYSTANIVTGEYVHLAVTRDQITGEKKLYVNGNLDAFDFDDSSPLNLPQQLAIGMLQKTETGTVVANPNTYYGLNGELDDIQIYSGVLASNDVAYIFNNPGSTVADFAGSVADPLAISLNAPQLVWTTSGDAAWFPETATNYDGLSAAQSGVINAGQSSTLQTIVANGTSGSDVNFWWQTLDEDGAFHLGFYIDGQLTNQSSGTTAWTQSAYFLGPGTHTLQWVATTDNTDLDSPTNDAGWVDQVRLTPVPLVKATASPTNGPSPLAVQFAGPAVDTLGNAITNWNWNFGDGYRSSAQNPAHTYLTLGTFSPALSTVNAAGTVPLTIGPGLITTTIAYSNIVYASASPTVGQAPLTVQFSTPFADSRGEAITNWAWTFGDGNGSSVRNPSHIYNSVGSFQPRLTTLNSRGETPLTVGPRTITATKLPPSAVVANLPGTPAGFTYHDFGNPKSLQFLGSATNLTTSDGAVVQLTPSAIGQAGAAWSAVPIAFGPNIGFSTFFTFRLSHPGGLVDSDGVQGGDGIAFLIQSAGYVCGSGGGGIGYAGINNSFAVEFDTWNNGTQYGNPGDLNGNHVAVNIDGVLNDPVSVAVTNAMNDGNIWYAWVDYEGVSQDLEVRASEIPVRPVAPTLDVTVNLPAILGTTNAFVGFTGGTGAAYNEQDVLSWKFLPLPTTRVTGSFALTNLPAGFQISGGVVLAQHKYIVAGHMFTNYSYAPITVTTNAGGQLTFESKPAELVPDSALPNPSALDEALSNNAAALDANDFMEYAVLATYDNSTTVGEGAILSSYNNNSGFAPFLQNAAFDTVYPIYEDDYVNAIYNMNQNSYHGLAPDPGIVAVGTEGASNENESAPVETPENDDGNYEPDLAAFSLGRNLGTLTARQQVIYSPPLPLVITSPRSSGTNFLFNFGTVSNQSYTVWANFNLATTNWVSYTNLLGDGYMQKILCYNTNSAQMFYRLSSP